MKTTHIRVPTFNNLNEHIGYKKGAITIVSTVEHGTIFYGVAFCHKSDTFKKSVGHNIANTRLKEETLGSWGYAPLPENSTHGGIVLRCLCDILLQNNTPMGSIKLLHEAISFYSSGEI